MICWVKTIYKTSILCSFLSFRIDAKSKNRHILLISSIDIHLLLISLNALAHKSIRSPSSGGLSRALRPGRERMAAGALGGPVGQCGDALPVALSRRRLHLPDLRRWVQKVIEKA